MRARHMLLYGLLGCGPTWQGVDQGEPPAAPRPSDCLSIVEDVIAFDPVQFVPNADRSTQKSDARFTVRNACDTAIEASTLTWVQLGPLTHNVFTLDSLGPRIAAGDTRVHATFRPPVKYEPTDWEQRFALTSGGNVLDQLLTVGRSGRRELTVDPVPVDFGRVGDGCTASGEFRIRNTGVGPVQVERIEELQSHGFVKLTPDPPLPWTIEAEDDVTLHVDYTPVHFSYPPTLGLWGSNNELVTDFLRTTAGFGTRRERWENWLVSPDEAPDGSITLSPLRTPALGATVHVDQQPWSDWELRDDGTVAVHGLPERDSLVLLTYRPSCDDLD